jgi:Fe-S-cluster containining protein
MTGVRPVEDTAPCVGCGLCCNGALFVRAVVTPGEEPRLIEYGLELVTHDERTHFLQPCPHQSCGRCKIYEERFDICRSFRCALLKRYQAGEIDLPEARDTVERALALLAQVTSEHPAAVTYVGRNRLRHELAGRLKTLDPSERGPIASQLLKIVAVDFFFDQQFRDKKGQETEGATKDSNSRRNTPVDKAVVKRARKTA